MSRHTLVLILAIWLVLVIMQRCDVSYLAYSRHHIVSGEYWRLITGHLIHLNSIHLLLNMLGVALVLMLFDQLLAPWQWLVALLTSALMISLLIYCYLPQVQGYVGLSGVIHALYMIGVIQLLKKQQERHFAIILIIMLTFKLLTENVGQGISLTADIIGGHVLFQAHVYGALAGLLLGVMTLRPKMLNVPKK